MRRGAHQLARGGGAHRLAERRALGELAADLGELDRVGLRSPPPRK